MERRAIGSLSVSVIGLGCNQLGTKACDEASGEQVVLEALDAGIMFFDTSDEYGRDYANPDDLTGWGRSEEILGHALRRRRDEVVIASKFGPYGPVEAGQDLPLRSRADARGVRIAVEESLGRLGTDRIDLYQLHFPDPSVPLEETLTVLDELLQEGKVREIGCSNFTADGLDEASGLATGHGLRPFASTQGALSVLQRGALHDVVPACERLGIAFIPYYPLASGVLTGKYRRDDPPPPGTRLADQVSDELRGRILSERTFTRVEQLEAYAADHGHSLLELAFAWLLGHAPVATVIAGASKPGQASTNGRAGGWCLTPSEVAEVDELVASVS